MHPDLNGNNGPTPTPRLLAGKYRDVEELEKGYENLNTMAQDNWRKLQEIEQRLAQDSRMNPAEQRETRRNPVEALDEVGVPSDAIMELVRQGVQDTLRPMFEAQNARAEVQKNFPDFLKFEDEVAAWVASNPQTQSRYAKLFNADQGGAMEWAITSYLRSKQSGPVDQGRENSWDAGLPPSGSAEQRGADNFGRDEDMQKELQRAQATGDWSKYVARRLEGTISDKHYEGLSRY